MILAPSDPALAHARWQARLAREQAMLDAAAAMADLAKLIEHAALMMPQDARRGMQEIADTADKLSFRMIRIAGRAGRE